MLETSFKKIKIFSYTLIIAFVLIGNVMFAILNYNQNYSSELLSFNANSSVISNYIFSIDILDYKVLTQYTSNDLQIMIGDKNTDQVISYGRIFDSSQSQNITDWAYKTAISEYDFGKSIYYGNRTLQNTNFISFKEKYSNTVLLVYYSEDSASQKTLTIIHTLNTFYNGILKSSIIFAILSLLLMLILFVVSNVVIKMAIQPVEESRIRQGDFISSASHELRSPINVIMSSLSVLEKARYDDAVFTHHHNIALSECKQMTQLINNMLTLAKTSKQDIVASYTYIHPEELISTCYDRFKNIVTEKGLFLKLDLPDNPIPKCKMDSNLTMQILTILIDNAISYTLNGGITLKFHYDNKNIYYSVIDTGSGIPNDIKDKIFEKFYTGEPSHTNKTHCGLGLSIALDLLYICRGNIKITDTPGGGSTFTVSFSRLYHA